MEAAALSLASGGHNSDASFAAGVSVATVKLWLSKPFFREAIAALRAEMTKQAMAVLVGHATAAAHKIAHLMNHSENERIQLGAASKLLEMLLNYRQLVDHEERIAALERTHGAKPSPLRGKIA
jgi:hypothetical protein